MFLSKTMPQQMHRPGTRKQKVPYHNSETPKSSTTSTCACQVYRKLRHTCSVLRQQLPVHVTHLQLNVLLGCATFSSYVLFPVSVQCKKMPKESLRDKLDGNELDLSLGNLESIPVKELVSLNLQGVDLTLCDCHADSFILSQS